MTLFVLLVTCALLLIPVVGTTISSSKQPFCWKKHWYPVGLVDHINPSHPHLVRLLDKRFAVWKGANSEWHTFDDACPHRLASLALGRIDCEKDTLMCRYHGWSFQGDGHCSNIPMTRSEGKTDTSFNRVGSYPTQSLLGLLWVWPDNSKDCFLEAALEPVPVPAEFANVTETSWTSKEWPLDWLAMIENNMDPSHAPFTHDGVQHFKPHLAQPMTFFQKVGGVSAKISMGNPNISDHLADPEAALRLQSTYELGGEDGFVMRHSGYSPDTMGANMSR